MTLTKIMTTKMPPTRWLPSPPLASTKGVPVRKTYDQRTPSSTNEVKDNLHSD